MNLWKWRNFTLVAALCFVFTGTALAAPTLKLNSKGHEVLVLQQKLHSVGYAISELDGVFGAETEKAVRAFQKDQKITVTGVVTNVTWRALRSAKEIDEKNRTPLVTVAEASGSGVKTPGVSVVKNGATVIDEGKVNPLIATAKKYIGVKYVFGGTTPKGFDCSGYLQYIFAQHGVKIPRLADEQYTLGKNIKSKRDLSRGDLVFFTTYEAGVSHCGLYIGDNNFIHASSHGVRIDSMSDAYWSARYIGAKRVKHEK